MRGKRREGEGEGGGRIEAMALASVCIHTCIHTYIHTRVCAKNAVSDDLFSSSSCLRASCLRSIPFSFFFFLISLSQCEPLQCKRTM